MANPAHADGRTLRAVLETYDPRPSDAFHRRMAAAPWRQTAERPMVAAARWRLLTPTPRLAAALLALVALTATLALASPDIRAGMMGWLGWRPTGAEQPAAIASAPATTTDPAAFAGRYAAQGPAASSPGRALTLALAADGTATLTSDYRNGRPAIVERGGWRVTAPGRTTVTLTGRQDRTYAKPTVVVFELRGEALVAVEYDPALFGSAGLQLWRTR